MSRHAIWAIAIALGTATCPPVTRVAQAQDAGVGHVEVRWERPAAGTLDRGLLGVPTWTVLGVGGIALAASALALIASARRARRGAR